MCTRVGVRRVLRSHGAGITFALSQPLRDLVGGQQNTRWWDSVPTQYLAKRAIRAPGGPRWVPGPHPGEALGDCQCPVSGIDRDRQTWHTGSSGVTTDHALWPNRHHNRQSGGGMNRVTGTNSTDDHFVTEQHQLLLLLQHMLHFCPLQHFQLHLAGVGCKQNSQQRQQSSTSIVSADPTPSHVELRSKGEEGCLRC